MVSSIAVADFPLRDFEVLFEDEVWVCFVAIVSLLA
jgi:hypothetical protein